ncbi:methyltransferase domain-containing protein [Curtobacterium sp. VKM Ac-1395]|uniref:methyltransferase domain-containing protein n=1 Tax=Curtobacterium sp. VKM Ac-1395 TaxID=2783815 RepID=UPI001889F69C|nr:methyltransferase domain-containing protein [Curtobacterium sp. VKM Ac-1395]MBF4588650.1 methyltransferase domain-containing protein [Curtobacterium sp. VKM Ac-1395]
MTRRADGTAGNADQGSTGVDSTRWRRPEPAFARAVKAALGDARTVLHVSTDADAAVSYAPHDRDVTAVEPTADLPFPDDTFDAAMTAFSVPRWQDLDRALAEMRRVTRGPVVVLTRDPARIQDSWLAEYAPEVTAADARRHPTPDRIADALGGDVTTTRVPIPFTCVDGFSEAYYGRPERLLDPAARRADDAWGLVDEMSAARSVAALRTALESGAWDDRNGALRVRPSHDGSLVLLTATP